MEASDTSMSADGLGRQFAPALRVLPTLLETQAERYGSRRLCSIGDTHWSYSDARDIAAARAHTLAAAGIQAGDRVAILSGNRPEALEVLLGCAWLGAVAVPINAAVRRKQLEQILNHCGARLLVAEASLLEVVAELAPGAALQEVWVAGGDLRALPQWLAARTMPALGDAIAAQRLRPADLAMILYTSGTTGISKGVSCPHAQCFWWGANSAQLLGVGEADVLLTCLPLFHINAINTFYQALLTGSRLVIERRFSASAFWRVLTEHQATVSYLLGAMAPMLLAKPPTQFDRAHRVRIILGPAVPARHQEEFRERFGVALQDGYGSTETNFVIADSIAQSVPGLMGRVRPGFAARVVDEDDNPVPDGRSGELVLRADEPFAFASGYFGAADKTVEAWKNLWFHTGDRVARGADGRFRFIDRIKDSIRRRGENISAHEVEEVLAAHPAVAGVAVFPVPSDLAEDEVMAAIVTAVGVVVTPAELLDYCKTRMQYFAVPRYIEFLDALPKTENGKIQKFALRERGVTARTWDRDAHGYQLRD